MSDLKEWLDERLAAQRNQDQTSLDSEVSQPAVEVVTPPKATIESPCSSEELQPTDLELMRDQWGPTLSLDWGGLASPRADIPSKGRPTSTLRSRDIVSLLAAGSATKGQIKEFII